MNYPIKHLSHATNPILVSRQLKLIALLKLKHLFALTITLVLMLAGNTVVALNKEIAETPIARKNITIYKSVDANGRVTYSDEPNPKALKEEEIALPDYEPSVSEKDTQTRLETMAATTKRLQEDRRAREEDRRRNAERPAPVQTTPVVVENRVYRSPRYFRRHPYSHVYPPYPYRKDHHTQHNTSSIGINISGGSSKFRYGLSYGSQLGQHQRTHIQTPYRRDHQQR